MPNMRTAAIAMLLGSLCFAQIAKSDITPLRMCFKHSDLRVIKQPVSNLRLQWDPWTTSQMTTAVAGIILSEQMGYNVTLHAGISSAQVYKALSEGDVHLAFEVWPFGNPVPFKKYAREFVAGAEDESAQVYAYRYTNLFGRSGIFETAQITSSTPMLQDALSSPSGQQHYTKEQVENPEYGEWSGSSLCSSGNCTVQILHITPQGYDEGQVEELVKTLGIPAKVAYLGQTAHTDAIWSAVTKRSGSLVYSYVPNTNQHGISIDSLSRAKIPPRLDFKPQQLHKLAWPGLRDNYGGDALSFIADFDLTKSDYADLAKLYDNFQDAQDAACVWIKENHDKWSHLVKFPEREKSSFVCGASTVSHGHCDETYTRAWFYFGLQLALAIAFSAWSHIARQPPPFPDDIRAQLDRAISKASIGSASFDRKRGNRIFEWFLDRAHEHRTGVEFVDEVHDVPCIFKHIRTYENFILPNVDTTIGLPPAGGNDRWASTLSRSALYPYLFFSSGDGLKAVFFVCLALGFFSGALSTLFFLIIRWETFKFDVASFQQDLPTLKEGTLMQGIDKTSGQISGMINAFLLLPSFLLLGYLGYAVSRWRGFQDLSFWILGSLNNAALVVGSSINDGGKSEASKRLAFRVYRYLTVTHILCHKVLQMNPWLNAVNFDDLVHLGLLTRYEASVLAKDADRAHEIVNSWLAMEMFDGSRKDGILHRRLTCDMATKIRGNIGAFHGHFLIGQPNLWSGLMKLVCDLLVALLVFGNPFIWFLYANGPFQWVVLLYTWLTVMPYLSATTIVKCLSNPYTSSHDMFNGTAVIAWGERAQFQNLRCSFNLVQDQRSVKDHHQADDEHAIVISSAVHAHASAPVVSAEVAHQLAHINIENLHNCVARDRNGPQKKRKKKNKHAMGSRTALASDFTMLRTWHAAVICIY